MNSMGFSREQSKINAIATKLRIAKTMAIVGSNPDFKLKHPDWVRDAQKKDFTLLNKRVKEDAIKFQDAYTRRRNKINGSFKTGDQVG